MSVRTMLRAALGMIVVAGTVVVATAASGPASGSASADPAATATGYTFTDLGAGFEPSDVNDAGTVVGYRYDDDGHTDVVVWRAGTVSTPQEPTGPICQGAPFVDTAGDVAAAMWSGNNTRAGDQICVPFVWPVDADGGNTSAPRMIEQDSTVSLYVSGMNAAGDLLITKDPFNACQCTQVTGPLGSSPYDVPDSRLPTSISTSSFTYFGAQPPYTTSTAVRLATLAHPDQSTALDFYPGHASGNGWIVGGSRADGTVSVLRSPAGAESTVTARLTSVNDSGNAITTSSYLPNGGDQLQLVAGLVPGSPLATAASVYVTGLNDNNDIIGFYYPTANSQTPEGFLLQAPSNSPPVVNSTGDRPATNGGAKGCDTGQTVTVEGKSVPECTLRAAIQAENAGSVTQKKITFALPTDGATPGMITPASALPALKATGVTVDGSWNGGTVQLNGTDVTKAPVLEVSGGTDTVTNLAICQAAIGAVEVDASAGHDTVTGLQVCATAGSGGTGYGVLVKGSPAATIGGTTTADRNVIDSADEAVAIEASSGVSVTGNWLGVQGDGTAARPNLAGVVVRDSTGTVIGGPTDTPGTGAGNVIVGHDPGEESGPAGVTLWGQSTTVTGAVVAGNLIGPMPDGSLPDGGQGDDDGFAAGVNVIGLVSGAAIGGTTSGARNVIAGAVQDEVELDGTHVVGTSVQGDYLGVGLDGKVLAPSSYDAKVGLLVAGAVSSTIGGTGGGNVIAGHATAGVLITTKAIEQKVADPGTGAVQTVPGTTGTAETTATTVADDTIGPDADGTTTDAAHAQENGVFDQGTGDTIGPDDQISFNGTGALLAGAKDVVVGDKVGTNPAGTDPLPNGVGVAVGTGATGARVGVPGTSANVISGNLWGVVLAAPATLQNNRVGTVANGLSALPAYAGTSLPDTILDAAPTANTQGPLVTDAAAGSVIGGTRPGQGNVISGGPYAGLWVKSAATVQGNDIGVGVDGTSPVPNASVGIRLSASATVGTDRAATKTGQAPDSVPGANVIANNAKGGVLIDDGVSGVSLLSDSIHDNTGGSVLWSGSANGGLAAPTVQNAFQFSGDSTLALLKGTPGATVQLYVAANCADGQPGQGAKLLFTDTFDPSGSLVVPVPTLAVGTSLDAIVTTADGSSRFSTCQDVMPQADASAGAVKVAPGAEDTADGDGFTAGEPVTGSLHSAPVSLGTQTADSSGRVHFAFTVPGSMPAGPHWLILVGGTSGKGGAVRFTVTGHTGTSVACTPSTPHPRIRLTCTATVRSTASVTPEVSPTGAVSWAVTHRGSVGAGRCTLAATSRIGTSTCRLTVTAPAAKGGFTITATYHGDTVFGSSAAARTLRVTPAPVLRLSHARAAGSHQSLSVVLRCAGSPCRGVVTVLKAGHSLGAHGYTLSVGGHRKVVVRLTATGRRALHTASRRYPVTLRLRATVTGGPTRLLTLKVR